MAYILLGAGAGAVLLGGLGLWLASWETALAQSSSDVRLLLGAGAAAGALLGRAWRPVSAERAVAWAARRQVRGLGEDAVALLQRFIRRSSGWRTTAVLFTLIGGFVAVAVVNASGGTDTSIGAPALTIADLFGLRSAALLYVVAALGVELSRRGKRAGVAVLSPRNATDYVSPFATFVQRRLAPLPVALALLAWLVTGEAPAVTDLAMAVGVLVLLLGIEVSQQRIVARAQRWAEPDVVAADDLARASTAHALTGGFCAVATIIASDVLSFEVGAALPSFLGLLVNVFDFALGIAGLGLWAGFGTEYASTVERPLPRDRPSTTTGATTGEVGA